MERVGPFLAGLPYASEVIIVDDGSGPAGRDAAARAVAMLPDNIKGTLLGHERNRGNGAAVRTGCLAALGMHVSSTDADLATPPEDLPGLLAALDAGADMAVGVRTQTDGLDMRDQRALPRR